MTIAYEQNQSFGHVIDILEAIGATYAIWGGLAVVAYGEHKIWTSCLLVSGLR